MAKAPKKFYLLFHYILIRYLRLPIQEVTGPIIDSSNERHEVFSRFGVPKSKVDVINMLGDQSGKNHTVFRENGGQEFIKTVAMGKLIYLFTAGYWLLFTYVFLFC